LSSVPDANLKGLKEKAKERNEREMATWFFKSINEEQGHVKNTENRREQVTLRSLALIRLHL